MLEYRRLIGKTADLMSHESLAIEMKRVWGNVFESQLKMCHVATMTLFHRR